MTWLRTAVAFLLAFALVSTAARLAPASDCCGGAASLFDEGDAPAPDSAPPPGGCLDDRCFCPCKVFPLGSLPEVRACPPRAVANPRCPPPVLTPGHAPAVFEPPRAHLS